MNNTFNIFRNSSNFGKKNLRGGGEKTLGKIMVFQTITYQSHPLKKFFNHMVRGSNMSV